VHKQAVLHFHFVSGSCRSIGFAWTTKRNGHLVDRMCCRGRFPFPRDFFSGHP
jgi:hypothetical protein